MTIAAIVFDLDGVLIDSEPLWEEVRRKFVLEQGGSWPPDTQTKLMGMTTQEWSSYIADHLGIGLSPEKIASQVIERLAARYREHLPLLPGAVEAVQMMAKRWPLGLASSSPTSLIEQALESAGISDRFQVALSSETVARGKPAPDVYQAVIARLDARPSDCVAIEDSTNGLRAAHAAGMHVMAVPRASFPPQPEVLAAADLVLYGLKQISIEAVERLG